MTKKLSPKRWANNLAVILKTVYATNRFPVDVKNLALDYSTDCFSDDPITHIIGDSLPKFDGALLKAEEGKEGWGIIYNKDVSLGRINFTLAHEFGHYLVHRVDYPNGFRCGTTEMAQWDSEYAQIESQANEFAANLLMPLDDFKLQIGSKDKPSFDHIGTCSDRYEVSLIAAILRWLQYTERRSVLVVSRDDFILWSRSSKSALRNGLFYKTRNQPPIEIPTLSLAAQGKDILGTKAERKHKDKIWLNQRCVEHVLFSDQYDFTISLLHFSDFASGYLGDENIEGFYGKFT